MRQYISSDKNIREFVENILGSGKWEIARRGKHVVIRHMIEGANKILTVPSTPSGSRSYTNFCKDYYRYLRQFFIRSGRIQNGLVV